VSDAGAGPSRHDLLVEPLEKPRRAGAQLLAPYLLVLLVHPRGRVDQIALRLGLVLTSAVSTGAQRALEKVQVGRLGRSDHGGARVLAGKGHEAGSLPQEHARSMPMTAETPVFQTDSREKKAATGFPLGAVEIWSPYPPRG
jgi:hypothetical protein